MPSQESQRFEEELIGKIRTSFQTKSVHIEDVSPNWEGFTAISRLCVATWPKISLRSSI